MSPSTDTKQLVPPKLAAALELLGFKYRIEHNFDLSQIDLDKWVQTRESANYAPQHMVARYAVQMASSVFPPPVFSNDLNGIDGRTRIAARRKRNENFCAAIILDEAYEGADDKRRHEMRALGAMLNSVDGEPLTKAEIRAAARTMIELNWSAEVIARELGAPASDVRAVKRELAAEAKLAELGVELHAPGNGKPKLDGPVLRAIASKDIDTLNNAPARQLVDLTIDAGLNQRELFAIAKDMHAAGSDAGALAVVEQQKSEMQTRIRDKGLTGNGEPPASRQLRQRLGWINKFAGEESRLVEASPGAYEAHLEALVSAVDVLTVTLALQRERVAEQARA